MWNKIAKNQYFGFCLSSYIHAKRHATWHSLHGLNNEHITNTTDVLLENISTENYSRISLNLYYVNILKSAGNSLIDCDLIVVKRRQYSRPWRHHPLGRYVTNWCNSTECSFRICVHTCFQTHRCACNAMPSSTDGNCRLGVIDLKWLVHCVTWPSVARPLSWMM